MDININILLVSLIEYPIFFYKSIKSMWYMNILYCSDYEAFITEMQLIKKSIDNSQIKMHIYHCEKSSWRIFFNN